MSIVNMFPGGATAEDYCGTLSFSGTYASSTYYTASGCYIASNLNTNTIIIVVKGGTTLSYENIIFNAISLPPGVSLITSVSTSWGASVVGAGQYYCAILTGVTKKMNVAGNFSAVNATYDYVQCDLTVTEAT